MQRNTYPGCRCDVPRSCTRFPWHRTRSGQRPTRPRLRSATTCDASPMIMSCALPAHWCRGAGRALARRAHLVGDRDQPGPFTAAVLLIAMGPLTEPKLTPRVKAMPVRGAKLRTGRPGPGFAVRQSCDSPRSSTRRPTGRWARKVPLSAGDVYALGRAPRRIAGTAIAPRKIS